jgi:hypothetical protein
MHIDATAWRLLYALAFEELPKGSLILVSKLHEKGSDPAHFAVRVNEFRAGSWLPQDE